MNRKLSLKSLLTLLVCFIKAFLCGCGSNSSTSPDVKANLSRAASNTLTIYDVLEEYPGLENFFTYGDLEIEGFERRLFGDFLGNDSTADVIVSGIDLFPKFINMGAEFQQQGTNVQIFSNDVAEEMESKGPIPDLIANYAVITENIIGIDDEKKLPFYDYLDKLQELENSIPESKGTLDYILDILVDVAGYLDTLDEEDVNLFMNYRSQDEIESQSSEDGRLDFADVDELIEKLTTQAPDGMIEILEAIRAFFYDEEFKDVLSSFLHNFAIFLGNDRTYAEIKALLLNIHKDYDKNSLGEIIDRGWAKGPIIGEGVEGLDIPDYGADGKAEIALKELLKHPKILIDLIESVNLLSRYGATYDRVDDGITQMIETDPFCFDRKGDGEFGNGEFYQPTDDFSFKNFSMLRCSLVLFSRWDIPFTFTAPMLFESEGAEKTKKLIRSMIPQADTLPVGSFVWFEVYEKDPDKLLGGGSPVTEKRGYGMMKNGVYVAPPCPELITAGTIPFYTMGNAMYNGPHDNIYDNLVWHYYEQNLYLVIDLVQFAPYVPLLKNTILPFFKLAGIKQLPITLGHIKGAMGLINLELSNIMKNMPAAITNDLVKAGMPQWIVNAVMEVMKKIMPMATPIEGEPRVYMLAKDTRDTANLVWSIPFYDPDAFHLDRFLDEANPENYLHYYDVSEYTYEKNKDTANPIVDAAAPLFVSAYLTYTNILKDYPTTMDAVEERLKATKEAIGTSFPACYYFNMMSAFYENSTETPVYDLADTDVYHPVYLMESLLAMTSTGTWDELLKLTSILGKPELKTARTKLFEGIAKLVATIDEDTKTPYTFAAEILKIPERAIEDEKRWDALKLSLDTYHGLLAEDSDFEIVSELVDLLDHLTGVEVSDEDWHKASEGIVEVLKNNADARVGTRSSYQKATILNEINKLHIWGDVIDVMNQLVQDDGILSYILQGLEKDPDVSWDEVLEDSNEFLHSELMKDYEEGSFWKDMYYLLDFMAEAIENNNNS